MRATDGPKGSLLSTFRNSTDLESRDTNTKKTGTSGQNSRFASEDTGSLVNFEDEEDDEDDELTSTRAPPITGSSQSARARLPTTSPSTKVSDELEDVYCDVEDFSTPKQPKTKSLLGNLSDDDTPLADEQRSGDIKPTVWKSKNTKEKEDEEWKKQTQIMLREKERRRMNPQHIRGAGFDTEGVKKMAKKPLLGSGWDMGPTKKKPSTYKRKTFGDRNRMWLFIALPFMDIIIDS